MKQKQIELYRVRPGEHFTHDGVEYVKLDEAAGAVFALAVDAVIAASGRLLPLSDMRTPS